MKTSFKILLCLGLISFMTACGNAPAGEKAETGEEVETTPTENTSAEAIGYVVNTADSRIEWLGSKLTGDQHNGTIAISGGELKLNDGNIEAGSFTLDMNSITDESVENPEYRAKLEGHLKSGDFFETEKFPTGTFEIASVKSLDGSEGATHEITGNLTLKGITKSIIIPATVNIGETSFSAKTSSFTINRTEWDITYNSGLLGTAKDKMINDDVALVISIVAAPQQAAN